MLSGFNKDKTLFQALKPLGRMPLQVPIFFCLFFSPLFFPCNTFCEMTIKIGLLTPPEEAKADLGGAYLQGAEMAAAEVNSREGKKVVQILLVLRGGHYTNPKELNLLQATIVEERLSFLMGAITKEAILPVSRMARDLRVPFLAFPLEFLDAPSTGEEPANLFWISPAPEAFQRAAVRMVAQFPQKRFFLLARDSAIGRSLGKYFWEELRRLKPDAQTAGEIYLPGSVNDYSPSMQYILSVNAEVCVSHLGPKEWIRFAKTSNSQGYIKKIIHFELESGNLNCLEALKKAAPEGVWGVSAFPFWGLSGKESQEFVNKFRMKYKTYPGLDALSGYVSVNAVLEAVKKTGSTDAEKNIGALQGINLQTPVGPLAIRNADHRALWPIWCGISGFTSGYPFAILEDLKAFGPDSFSP
jgi:branched-chain amino acid transport system substrate-binding protein